MPEQRNQWPLRHALEDLVERFSFGELQRLSLTGDELDRSIDSGLGPEQRRYRSGRGAMSNCGVIPLIQDAQERRKVQNQYRDLLSAGAQHSTRTGGSSASGRLGDLSRTVENDRQMVRSHRFERAWCIRRQQNFECPVRGLHQHASTNAFQLLAQPSSYQMMKWTHKIHEIAIASVSE